MTTRQDAFVSYATNLLQKFLLENVWNTPEFRFHTNIEASLVSTTPLVRQWNVKSLTIPLPDSSTSPNIATPFYGYIVYGEVLEFLELDTTEWVAVSDLIESKQLDIRVHGEFGEMFYRPNVFFKRLESSCDVLMAIEAPMAKRVVGDTGDMSKVYVTFHGYNTTDKAITYKSAYVRSDTAAAMVYAMIGVTGTASTRTTFINGQLATPTSVADIRIADYVEIVNDPNISFEVILPLSMTDDNAQYSSPLLNGDLRSIIHLPKSVNTPSYLITHNMCDIYVRSSAENASARTGYWLHRSYGSSAIMQLTHQDFAITKDIMLNYSTLMSANGELSIVIKCRLNPEELRHYLIRDNSYINLLYLNTDSVILEFLSGNGPADIPCWEGEALEAATYGQMMFDAPTSVQALDMTACIETLGYHTAATLVNPRVFEYKCTSLTPSGGAIFSVPTPQLFSMIGVDVPSTVMSIVYINGKKATTAYNLPTANAMSVAVPASTGIVIGDTVMLELYEYTSTHGKIPTMAITVPIVMGEEIFVPQSYTVPYGAFDVYQRMPVSTSYERIGAFGTFVANESYAKITTGFTFSSRTTGGYTVVFDVTTAGNDYLIVNTASTALLHGGTFTPSMSEVPKPLVFGPYTMCDTFTEGVPATHGISDTGTFLVFLNGFRLVEGMDFYIRKIYNTEFPELNWFISSEVIITNMTYLTSDSNTMDIYYTNDTNVAEFSGYVLNEYLAKGVLTPAWYSGSTTVTVAGLLQSEVVEDNYDVYTGLIRMKRDYGPDGATLPFATNGALYHASTKLSRVVENWLNQYRTDTDDARLDTIYAYLQTIWPADTNFVLIDNPNSIYSFYMAKIISDVLENNLTISFQIGGFADQVTAYDWIKEIDPVFSAGLDLRYVDVYPIWHRYDAPRTLWKILNDLTKELMPSDPIANGDAADAQ